MDRIDAIADRALRGLLLHVRASAEPVSADEAAAALGIHRNVARSRLERLVEAGWLEPRFERRSGRAGPGAGRPAKLYAVPPESASVEFPARRLALLVGRLLEELPAAGREEALRRAGADFGRQLAREARLRPAAGRRTGLERVCAAVRALGFQASLEHVEGDTAVIRTPTCPLRSLVVARAEAAELDRGMWAGLVERGVRDVAATEVVCETHSCLDGDSACSVVITVRPRD